MRNCNANSLIILFQAPCLHAEEHRYWITFPGQSMGLEEKNNPAGKAQKSRMFYLSFSVNQILLSFLKI